MAAVTSEAAQDSTTQKKPTAFWNSKVACGGYSCTAPRLGSKHSQAVRCWLSDKEKPVRAQEEASQGGMSHLGKVEEGWGVQTHGRLGKPLEL